MFRIYNPVIDKFSKGGLSTHWSKNGKVWATMGNLKSHLSMLKVYPHIYIHAYITDNCVVINVLTDESFPVKLLIDNPENFK